jgi:hypothetical protein
MVQLWKCGVLLPIGLLLLLSLLGCAEYGTLVHRGMVTPPELHVQIGHYQVDSAVVAASCAPQHCGLWQPAPPPTPIAYDIWLLIRRPARSRAIRLVHLPIAPP